MIPYIPPSKRTVKANMTIYKDKISNLVRRIEEIITEYSLNNKVNCSELIMKELRKEYILLPSEYINSFLYTREQLCSLKEIPFSLDFNDSENEDSIKHYQELSENYKICE